MNTKLLLKNFVTIYSGYTFREAIVSSAFGKTKVAQAKDINQNNFYLKTELLTKTDLDIKSENSFIQKGDVLLTSRGAGTHKANVFDSNESNIIASASLYIIRLNDKNILPEYLTLYLNSDEGQAKLAQVTSGAYIQNITKSNLENLEIPIPTLAQQKNLVDLQKNLWSQDEINEQKKQIRNKIIKATLNNIIKRTTK